MTLCYRYTLGGKHGIAGKEIQENPVQNKSTVIHIATKAAPFVTQEIRDQGMTEELDTLFRDLQKNSVTLRYVTLVVSTRKVMVWYLNLTIIRQPIDIPMVVSKVCSI